MFVKHSILQRVKVLHVILFGLYLITLGRHDRHTDAQSSAIGPEARPMFHRYHARGRAPTCTKHF